VLLVSHDRALLDAVGTRTIAVERGTLRSYEGGWQEYSRVREERKAAGEDPAARAFEGPAPAALNGSATAKPQPAASPKANGAAATSASAKERPPKPAGPSKNAVRELGRLEKAVEEAEAALVALEDELADPAAWATKYESAKSTARHTAAKRAVDDAYAALEEHMEKTGA
jgi:ATP-binding cassette subfamily F protein 3